MLSHVISYYLMFILEHVEHVEVPGHLPGTLSGAEGWVSPSGIVPGLGSLGLKIARSGYAVLSAVGSFMEVLTAGSVEMTNLTSSF